MRVCNSSNAASCRTVSTFVMRKAQSPAYANTVLNAGDGEPKQTGNGPSTERSQVVLLDLRLSSVVALRQEICASAPVWTGTSSSRILAPSFFQGGDP